MPMQWLINGDKIMKPLTDLDRFDKLVAIQRKRYLDLKTPNEASADNIDFVMFLLRRTDLIWLIAEMEIKADEHHKRTGKDVSESLKRIMVLKDMEQFLNKLQERFDVQQIQIEQLNAKIKHYEAALPHAKLSSNQELVWHDGSLKYVKKKTEQIVDNDNY